jgi:hypothetical protein
MHITFAGTELRQRREAGRCLRRGRFSLPFTAPVDRASSAHDDVHVSLYLLARDVGVVVRIQASHWSPSGRSVARHATT